MLQLQVKDLHQGGFSIEIHENESVKTLKERIAARDDLREKYDAELLKLLCGGKVMDDDEQIKTFPIKPDGFLVLVKQTPGKPKPPPKKKPNQGFNNSMGGFQSPFGMPNSFMNQPFQQNSFMQQSFDQNSFTRQPFGQNSFTQQPFQQPTYTPPPQPPATNTAGDLDSFSTAESREEALQNLLVMGFDRSQSEKALRACLYNVNAALDYLTSGNMPAEDDNPTPPQVNQPNPTVNLQQGGGGMGGTLQEMSRMLQQNPDQLQTLKQRLQGEHPEIAEMIDNDPQGFLNLIRQAGVNDDGSAPTNTGGGGQGGGAVTVSLTAQEQGAITRLQEMGFDKNRAIEAFLACDRNEELAVHYLLNAFD